MKRTSTTHTGGGGSPDQQRSERKNRQRAGKIMSKKKGLKTRRFKIAHPHDPQGYVDQCGFVISWFKEMFKRVESGNRKSTQEARVALGNKNSSAQWAWRLLAHIDVWIEKYRKKLGGAYEAHRRKLSTVFRNDVWEPASPLYQALHRELWLCQFYRREIPRPKAQRYLPKLGLRPPKEYLALMKLPPLSVKSWPEWEKPLWRLVKENNPDLLENLRASAPRKEASWSFPDGKSRMKLKSRRLYWKDFQKQFRNHLKAIARQYGIS
jgi:hypothetical protein